MTLEVVSRGLRFGSEVKPNVKDRLIGLIKVESRLQYAHKDLVCP